MSKRWWERDPARYESELEELKRAGLRYVVDDDARRDGHLRIEVFPVINGAELRVVALFPDLYPFFRFEVQAPTENLLYHQHPFAKTLCLIPRSTGWWQPESDRLAFFLRDRLSAVIQSGKTQQVEGGTIEDEQAEPFTDYYQYHPSSIMLIDGAWTIPREARYGQIVLGAEGTSAVRPPPLLRAALLEIRDSAGRILHQASEEVTRRYTVKLDGRWVYREAPPSIEKQDELFEDLAKGDLHAQKNVANKVQGGALTIRVALFPEEHHWRGIAGKNHGQGWLVACCFTKSSTVNSQQPRSKRKGRNGRASQSAQTTRTCYLSRIGRFALHDVLARAPELDVLTNKTVAVFGLGCVGAPSALEFARAGIAELRMLDHDVVDSATTLRWPRGLSAAGHLKTLVLEQIIRSDYPFTIVKTMPFRLGSASEGRIDEWQAMDDIFSGASLVYDATAEPGVQYFLAEQARRRGLPFIAVSGTEGGWGGVLVRLRPEITKGCWLCYLYASDCGDLPKPSHNSTSGNVQPEGCADPTFVGTGFDLGELALSGVRLAVSTLSNGQKNGYPPMDWDIAILNLRDHQGQAMMPTWTTHQLHTHPMCPRCSANE